MSHEIELYDQGRAALAAGDVRPEQPLQENGKRWGAAAVLRPKGPVLRRLAELSDSIGRAAGSGHWAHRISGLHFTLRSLEHFRSSIPDNDPRRTAYAQALDAAAEGLPPTQVEMRGVCPHPAGVILVGYPVDDTLVDLQGRFAAELRARDLAGFESWIRNRWYLSLIHFAGPLVDVDAVIAWCDERRNMLVGVVDLDVAEIARWHHFGGGVRLKALHSAPLSTTSCSMASRTSRNASG